MKKNFLKYNYKKSFEYIKGSKSFIYAAILIFLFASLIGFFIQTPSSLEKLILNFIEELLNKTQNLSLTELTRFIFLNNLQGSFLALVSGIFLGIFPILSAIFNGYIIGFVAARSVSGNGFLVLWRLFPHGIFELPALFISLGLGIKLSRFLFSKKKIQTLKEDFLDSLRVFIFVVIPLLIIAAIIESSLIFFSG